MFQKATKKQSRLRMGIHGPSGSGKTYSALSIGSNLGSKVALIDTEYGSAAKYGDIFDFDTCQITGDYHPEKFMKAINEAAKAGYEVIIVDSISHSYNGPGGVLELVEMEAKKAQARSGKYDTYGAWRFVTPIYNKLVQTILSCPAHVIVTARAKTEYAKGDDGKIKKLGMAPEVRAGFEYEMDIEAMLDQEHYLSIGKTRCPALDGKLFKNPGADLAAIVKEWLDTGEAVATESPHVVFLAEIASSKDAVSYTAALTKYKANKDKFTQEEAAEQMKALMAKHHELKASA